MNKVVIKEMDITHIEEISMLEKLCFAVPWSKQSFLEEIKNEKSIYLIASLDNIVVGYIGVWKIIDEGHITNIAVHPDYRKQRIGSKLLDSIISILNDCNIASVTLEVRESNIPAICLYEKFGFIKKAVRKKYYSDNKENALIMWNKNNY